LIETTIIWDKGLSDPDPTEETGTLLDLPCHASRLRVEHPDTLVRDYSPRADQIQSELPPANTGPKCSSML